jgi:tetratricopeptide (TPR) repeat protein
MRSVLSGLWRWDNRGSIVTALFTALTMICSGLPVHAALSFNGISGFSIRENGKTAIITLSADTTVRYQLSKINENQARLILYQAQLSKELAGENQTLRLPPNPLIQKAAWQKRADNLEILLTGPGLGKHLPKIEGDVAKMAEPFSPFTSKKMEKPVVVFPKDIPGKLAERPKDEPQTLSIAGAERIQPEYQAPEPADFSKPARKGPQITEIRDVTDATSAAPLKQEALLPSIPEIADARQTIIPEPSLATHPANVSPIRAFTFDEQGQPVQVLPKNAPLEVMTTGQNQPSYNTLFQEDAESTAERFLSDALDAYRQNRLTEARQAIEKALQLEPQNDEFLAALAEIQIKQQEFSQACETYRKACAQKPGQYEVRYAQALIRAGKRNDALRVLEQALLLNPQNVQAIYMLGTLNQEMGNPKSAILYLEQAAALSPQSSDILYNLGLAYEFSGNTERARTTYQKAMALNPDARDISAALQRVRQ